MAHSKNSVNMCWINKRRKRGWDIGVINTTGTKNIKAREGEFEKEVRNVKKYRKVLYPWSQE